MENNKITIKLVTPITTILFLAFFIAKIFNKIDWSWWWVFSPLWIPYVILLGIVGVLLILCLIVNIIKLIIE